MPVHRILNIVRKSFTGDTLLELSRAPLAYDHRGNPLKLGNIAKTVEKHPALYNRVPDEWRSELFNPEVPEESGGRHISTPGGMSLN